MNNNTKILTPISDTEYQTYLSELYEKQADGTLKLKFTVELDEDPSVKPLSISEKLAKVQALKDRLVVILNRALNNKTYWDSIVEKIDNFLESKKAEILSTDPEVQSAKNSELRNSLAEIKAKELISNAIFNGAGFDKKMGEIRLKSNEANAFYNEVKNIYTNLDDKSMALAIQTKIVIVKARLEGVVNLEDPNLITKTENNVSPLTVI